MKRTFSVWLIFALMLIIALGALGAGMMLIASPDGRFMSWTTDMLNGTFPNYLIPGLVLFLFVGVFPVFASISLLKLPAWRWPDNLNPSKKLHWAWATSWAAGTIMLVWIAVETVLLGYMSFLQPLVAAVGLLIILLTLMPATRRYCMKA
jgi:hypothetical protein